MESRIIETFAVLSFYVLVFSPNPGHGQDFGYDGNDGPSHWGEKYQHCVGKHQSPINIQEHEVQLVNLSPMVFTNFDWKPNAATLKNNGHTVVVTLETNKIPTISGGPLIGNYKFAQLHFHWGANDAEGSENTINNSSFPLELHMVFFQEAYGTFEASTEHPDGLAVLSFLYSSAEEENQNYQTLIEALPAVQDPQTTATLDDLPYLQELIAQDHSVYFTYGGSLTTPPCSEVVTWIEFKNTIPLAHKQIEVFRQLNSEHGKLSHNFRPVQPLHGRTIRLNRDVQQLQSRHEQRLYERSNDPDRNAGCNINAMYNSLSIMVAFILITLTSR